MDCKFKKKCSKINTDQCNRECFPYIVLHGIEGNSGYWGSTRVPKKYENCFIETLPIREENPNAFNVIEKYSKDVLRYVKDKGMGLYLFSVPNVNNRLGTGTGKTTSAITILHEYLIARVGEFIRNDFNFGDNPTMFIKLSEMQNIYNSQFRGGYSNQQDMSTKYFALLSRMKNVELLVIDDIGIRDLTDAFKNELYDVIDTRCTEDRATIYTSNYPINSMGDILGDRIVSRIEGQCYPVGFKGEDHRKGGLFR